MFHSRRSPATLVFIPVQVSILYLYAVMTEYHLLDDESVALLLFLLVSTVSAVKLAMQFFHETCSRLQ